jgi:hypothetical protein
VEVGEESGSGSFSLRAVPQPARPSTNGPSTIRKFSRRTAASLTGQIATDRLHVLSSTASRLRGLYLLTNRERPVSHQPFEFLKLLEETSRGERPVHRGHIAGPDVCGGECFSFDQSPLVKIPYKETKHFKLYKDFFTTLSRCAWADAWCYIDRILIIRSEVPASLWRVSPGSYSGS